MKKIQCDAFFLFLQKISLLRVFGFPIINLPILLTPLQVFHWVCRTMYQFHGPSTWPPFYSYLHLCCAFFWRRYCGYFSGTATSHTYSSTAGLYFHICFLPVHNRTLLLGRVRPTQSDMLSPSLQCNLYVYSHFSLVCFCDQCARF